jgi:hypothetical protein
MWIGALVVTIWLRPPPNDNPAIPRQERRQRAQAQHRSRTRRAWYSGSIRDHNIHRKYPFSLHSMGHFIWRNAPIVDQRQLQDQVNSLHDRVLRLQHQLQTLMRPQSLPRNPIEGERWESKSGRTGPVVFSVAKSGIGNETAQTAPIIDRSPLQVCMEWATHSGRTSSKPRQRRWPPIAT